MPDMRKITAFLPAELLAAAQIETRAGITETLRAALETYLQAAWSRRMLELEGKVVVDLDLNALREDRDFRPPDAGRA